MKLRTCSLVSFALFSLAARANAETAVYSGVECQQDQSNDWTLVAAHSGNWSLTGISNPSPDRSIPVVCPLSFTRAASDGMSTLETIPAPFGSWLLMSVRDTSRTSSVSCAMYAWHSSALYFGPSSHTCGLLNYCATDSAPAYVSGPRSTTALFVPMIPNGGGWIAAQIMCDLPPSGGNIFNSSGIQTYRMTYAP